MSHRSCLAILASLPFVGCAALLGGGATPEPPQERNYTVRYVLPKVNPVEGTTEVQDKNGVTIAVSTTPFAPLKTIRKDYRQLQTTFVMNEQYDYQVTSTPVYRVTPDNVRFKVKVVNNLNQVLRLAGTLVRFNVNGHEVSLDPKLAGFENLTSAMLTPREQKEFDIIGPTTEELPGEVTVGLMMYGVVTATDEAGNAAKRNNFEWFYKVAKENIVKNDRYEVETMKLRPSDVPRE